jgi:ABC-type Zn uptake system ZnuABC Zn-binding protein ZnuA
MLKTLTLEVEKMKRVLSVLILLLILLTGCSPQQPAQVAATTLPVYEFTCRITEGTDITVTRLVTENVSCLHDYALNVNQVKAVEAADLIVISGAGLEDFMHDLLHDRTVLDASASIDILVCAHAHDHEEDHGHHHEVDSHIWLSPANAKVMAQNICTGLTEQYPEHTDIFARNLSELLSDMEALEAYGHEKLEFLSTRDMITFHDGFGYFSDAFHLHILEAVEEESGSEASARELKHLIGIVTEHDLPAVFTERNGSVSAAQVICRETGAALFALDMAMSGDSWFDAMYHNIDAIKEAMG